MQIEQIFTPNDIPTVTYVDRAEHKLEQKLRDFARIPNLVVSLSGPSKSGKTVLVKKVVAEDCLIPVLGAAITSGANLWERVLHWMGSPSEIKERSESGTAVTGGAEAGGKAGIPLVAHGSAKASVSGTQSWKSETTKTFQSGGIDQVIQEIGKSEFAVFIDDFHYIKPEIRDEIGKQIKIAAENGVKIFTASVPHRSDDVVRSNPELRGRVAAFDLSYWSLRELVEIARRGFDVLNGELPPAVERRFAEEAFGSPQLMQSICLNLCYCLPIREKQKAQSRIEVSDPQIRTTLRQTSYFSDFSKMVSALHTGARTRGTERKLHRFEDGSRGDVYRAILLALQKSQASLSFPYEMILQKVKMICSDDTPVGSSITSALEQMHAIGEEIQPNASPLSWDQDTLDISDPYFLFFLRCSSKLADLSKTGF